jgi:hypothetical protein
VSDTVDDLSRFAPTLPRAVREAAARSDQLVREIGGDPDDPPAPATVADDPPADPAPIETPPFRQVPATVADDPPPPAPAPATTDWEQRYNTLKGKYDTEVPTLRNRLTQLEGLMATLSRAPPPAPPEPVYTPPPLAQIPKEDVDEWGQPLIERVQDWSFRRTEPELRRMQREIDELKGVAGGAREGLNKRSVEAVLDREMPGWQAVNTSQAWIDWLQETDWLSGNKRYDMVNDAYLRGDAQRTLAFFRAFNEEQTAVLPAPGTHHSQTVDPPAATVPLETLATPGRAPMGSQASGGAPAKRTWTGAQITAFYDRVNRGMYRGRDAEKARIEADLFEAQAEGRIIR